MARKKSKPDWARKILFSTGEAAKVCHVSQHTIIRCFDEGKLGGFRTPTGFRRIPRDALLRFVRENNIPADALDTGTPRILVVDDDEKLLAAYRKGIEPGSGLDVLTAGTGRDAVILAERFEPDLVILGYRLPDTTGDVVCRSIKAMGGLDATRVFIVPGSDAGADAIAACGADGTIEDPFDVRKVVQTLMSLRGGSRGTRSG